MGTCERFCWQEIVKFIREEKKIRKNGRFDCLHLFCCSDGWWCHGLCQKRFHSFWNHGTCIWKLGWFWSLSSLTRSKKLLFEPWSFNCSNRCDGISSTKFWKIYASLYGGHSFIGYDDQIWNALCQS